MLLFEKWKESYLNFFDKKNFISFFLICLKTMLQTYKAWLIFFGWAIFLYTSLDALYPAAHVPGFLFLGVDSLSWSLSAWLRFVGWYGLLFTLYLSCRPSVLPKGFLYSLGYLKHFALFLFSIFLVSWLDYLFVFMVFSGAPVHMYAGSASFLAVFSTLFFLHSKADMYNLIMSGIRGLKMFVYNAPICIGAGVIFILFFRFLSAIVFLVGYLISLKVGYYPTLFGEWLERVVYLIAMPVPVSIITNVYIKKVYEEFSLYFPSDAMEESM